ncbi:M15 family metallopeptidase [Verrucomicrobiales bacterium]|nr:M15 family metallopeptidase [Verrucomicrobiales bacterium]MDA7926758.1 M15 family metallopeptidase [Verrucomicrobiales bacterium]
MTSLSRLKRFLCLALLFSIPLTAFADLPEGFVYLKNVDATIETDVRYATSSNFVGKKVDGYQAKKIILTRRAAEALKKVQADLKTQGYALKVFDAYRPQRAVNHFMRWVRDRNDQKTKSKYYPDIEKSTLAGGGYISGRSSHSRGSTVDLTLVKLGKGEVDMGTKFDYFGPESSHNSSQVTPAQRANRQRLRSAMSRGGFASYHKEWWHYSLRNTPFSQAFDFPVK